MKDKLLYHAKWCQFHSFQFHNALWPWHCLGKHENFHQHMKSSVLHKMLHICTTPGIQDVFKIFSTEEVSVDAQGDERVKSFVCTNINRWTILHQIVHHLEKPYGHFFYCSAICLRWVLHMNCITTPDAEWLQRSVVIKNMRLIFQCLYWGRDVMLLFN